MKIEIKRWDDQEIIICGEYESVKDCLEKNKGKSFYRADLSWANLSSADLRSANLSSADLSWADLSWADLRSANLSSANLSSANLSSADLSSADLRWANLSSANLSSADLRSANLSSAKLSSADLSWANLSSANLSSADLRSANLSSADLSSANLSWAKNINKYLTTPLYTMLEQTGKIRAYKLVNKDNVGPFNGGIVYNVGEKYEEKEADTDETRDCSKGLHLATLDWCLREWREGYKILIAEFTKKDIACIPIGSNGKFRVSRCKIVGEKKLKDVGIK